MNFAWLRWRPLSPAGMMFNLTSQFLVGMLTYSSVCLSSPELAQMVAWSNVHVVTVLLSAYWPRVLASWYVGTTDGYQSCDEVCGGIGPCNEAALNSLMQDCSSSDIQAFLNSIAAVRTVVNSIGTDHTSSYDCSSGLSSQAGNLQVQLVSPMAVSNGECN